MFILLDSAIVLKNVPVIAVEEDTFHQLCWYQCIVSHKLIVDVMFELIVLAENRISREARSTKGSVLCGGWS